MTGVAARKISTDDLRQWTDMICLILESNGQSTFEVDQDLHWQLLPEDCFDLSKAPTPAVGSLLEAVDDLDGEADGMRAEGIAGVSALFHIAGHLSELIQFVGWRFGHLRPIVP